MTKVLYAEFTARPETVDRVDEMIRGLAEEVRREPGNEVFAVYREESEPLRFFVFEVYRDEQAFQEHISADYGAVFNAELRGLIVEDGSQLTWLTPSGTPGCLRADRARAQPSTSGVRPSGRRPAPRRRSP